MHHFFEFVMNHWALWLLFILLMGTLMYEESKANNLKDAISAQETVNRINNQNAKIIDIRKTEEFTLCHINNAVSVPTLEPNKIWESIKKWKKNPIILVSNQGKALGHIVIALKKKGLENIAILAGGMQEWHNQNLPTTVKEK